MWGKLQTRNAVVLRDYDTCFEAAETAELMVNLQQELMRTYCCDLLLVIMVASGTL